jgi:hypothetical protein
MAQQAGADRIRDGHRSAERFIADATNARTV